MVGLAVGWHYKNQIITVVYFLVIYIIILFSTGLVSSNYNEILQTSAIVLVLCTVSIIASVVIYQNRTNLLTGLNKEGTLSKESSVESSDVINFIDNAIEGIFGVHKDGKLIFCNNSLLELFGFQDDESIKKKNFFDEIFVEKGELEIFVKLLERSELIKNHRLKLKKSDGSEFRVRVNAKVIVEEETTIFIGTMVDITQQLKTETERKDELEALRSQKRSATYKASSAIYNSHVKSRFLAKMSHEIRTPMNSVLGFLTLIENGLFESEDELKDFAHNARVSADSLLDILNNILDISKIEAGKMELNEVEFSIRDEVEKALSIVSTGAKEKKLELSYTIISSIPSTLIGDSTRFRQVVVNLLGNAIKHTKTGAVRVDIDLIKKTRATAKIKTIVTDTGIGIPGDKISKLFKPFTQLDNEESVNAPGTGLGLLICKEFVTLMGGDIHIESSVDKGTTVSFTVVLGLEKNFLGTKDFVEMRDSKPLQPRPKKSETTLAK